MRIGNDYRKKATRRLTKDHNERNRPQPPDLPGQQQEANNDLESLRPGLVGHLQNRLERVDVVADQREHSAF